MNESNLISRQAAIDVLGDKPLAWTEGEYELGLQNQWQSDVDALKALPSERSEIIRCKDCLMHGVCRFEQGLGLDGYCSQAERRTDGTDARSDIG